MNFDQAVAVHVDWKKKLSSYLIKPDHSLKTAEIALDNKCDLGKWIFSEGRKFSHLPEFGTLKSAHARFHKAAADVVRRADAGQSISEEVTLGAKSEFATASEAVIRSIMELRSKI